MKRTLMVVAAVTSLATAGCASIIHGSNDTLTVNSLEEGTTLFVDGAPRGMTTAQVQVKRGQNAVVRASKKGCQDVTMTTSDSFDPVSLLGIFIDYGIISIPIDLISGNAWKLNPTNYTVTPLCKSGNA